MILAALTGLVWEATIGALRLGTGSHDCGFMNWYYFLSNILLENILNRVLFVLLVSWIIERSFRIGNLEAIYSKNMAASCSSTGLLENIHSEFSSESDSYFYWNLDWNRNWVWNIVVTLKPVLWAIYRILIGIAVNGIKY